MHLLLRAAISSSGVDVFSPVAVTGGSTPASTVWANVFSANVTGQAMQDDTDQAVRHRFDITMPAGANEARIYIEADQNNDLVIYCGWYGPAITVNGETDFIRDPSLIASITSGNNVVQAGTGAYFDFPLEPGEYENSSLMVALLVESGLNGTPAYDNSNVECAAEAVVNGNLPWKRAATYSTWPETPSFAITEVEYRGRTDEFARHWQNYHDCTQDHVISGLAGSNVRQIIDTAVGPAGVKKVRVTVRQAAADGNAKLTDMYVGKVASTTDYNWAATPTALTFNGSTQVVLDTSGGDAVATSDWVLVSAGPVDHLGVAFYVPNESGYNSNISANNSSVNHGYHKAGVSETGAMSVSGYTQETWAASIVQVEVEDAALYMSEISLAPASSAWSGFVFCVDMARFDTDFWKAVSSDAGNVRVADVSGNLLPFDVIGFDSTRKAGFLAWRGTYGQSSDATNFVIMVVDGASMPQPADPLGRNNVWVDYELVIDPSVNPAIDRSPNGHAVITDGTPDYPNLAGRFSTKCFVRTTGSNYFYFETSAGTGSLTVSSITIPDDIVDANQCLVGIQDLTANKRGGILYDYISSSDKRRGIWDSNNSWLYEDQITRYHHDTMACVYDGSTARHLVTNGVVTTDNSIGQMFVGPDLRILIGANTISPSEPADKSMVGFTTVKVSADDPNMVADYQKVINSDNIMYLFKWRRTHHHVLATDQNMSDRTIRYRIPAAMLPDSMFPFRLFLDGTSGQSVTIGEMYIGKAGTGFDFAEPPTPVMVGGQMSFAVSGPVITDMSPVNYNKGAGDGDIIVSLYVSAGSGDSRCFSFSGANDNAGEAAAWWSGNSASAVTAPASPVNVDWVPHVKALEYGYLYL